MGKAMGMGRLRSKASAAVRRLRRLLPSRPAPAILMYHLGVLGVTSPWGPAGRYGAVEAQLEGRRGRAVGAGEFAVMQAKPAAAQGLPGV